MPPVSVMTVSAVRVPTSLVEPIERWMEEHCVNNLIFDRGDDKITIRYGLIERRDIRFSKFDFGD